MDRTLKFNVLKAILSRYGVEWNPGRGKGSHGSFQKLMNGGVYSYPIPRHSKDVLQCYVRGVRKKFKLTPDDGVSDAAFYT